MDRYAQQCPCSCHGGGMDAPCDYDGGCGHLHAPTVDPNDPHNRRCARAGDCPGYERVDLDDEHGQTITIRIGAPLQQPRGLCRVCRDITASVISNLEDDYWGLYAVLGAGEGAADQEVLVRRSKELPVPIRVSVRDLAARIVTVTTTWAAPVAEQAGMRWDPDMVHNRSRPHAALAQAIGVLRWNTARLIDHEPIEVRAWTVVDDLPYTAFEQQDGIDAALELCQLHQHADTVRGLTELRHHLPAPCPRCEATALYRDNGDDHVYCARCRITYAEQDYRRLTVILADDYQAA